jgi:DNA-directed RNA polymerase II subunit RPB2
VLWGAVLQVLIAQERMAANHVYVFKKSQPSKYLYVAECRSQVEGSTRNASSMNVKMLAPKSAKAGAKGKVVSGSVIRASIPYVKADVPILILFRALGCVVGTGREWGWGGTVQWLRGVWIVQ